jgi:tetratricopeptide (TPR) repeat protein
MGNTALAAPNNSEHDTAFKNGLAQYGQGHYAEAINIWESIVTTIGQEQAFKVLYNLGLAYQATGDVTRAMERFKAFLEQAAAQMKPELSERVEDASKRVQQIESSHGAVKIASSKKRVVLTKIDSHVESRPAGYVAYLAPGPHVIEVYVGTNLARKIPIEVEKGKAIDVDTESAEENANSASSSTPMGVTPPPPNAESPMEESSPFPPPPLVDDDGARRTWIVVGASATVLSLALPLSFYFVAKGNRDQAEELGVGHSGYEDARSTAESWRTAYLISWALPAIVAAVTVGGVLLTSGGGKSGRKRALVTPWLLRF